MRGDRPKDWVWTLTVDKFTPHARGSTALGGRTNSHLLVYPACAGIDLATIDLIAPDPSLPRMRGDRPG